MASKMNEKRSYPSILPVGDCAVTVEFADCISEEVNKQIRNYIAVLKKEQIAGIIELVPTFRAVLVNYDPSILNEKELREKLSACLTKHTKGEGHRERIVRIPVCYQGKYGPDLSFVAQHAGISEEEVIRLHTSKPYLIYMLGFQPGFPYLGGLDPKLFTPRLETPRLKLEAGSVGIGGEQTGLYPMESPGGWQIIGRTPVLAYNPKKKNPIPYEAGDYIAFYSISEEEYLEIEKAEAEGSYQFEVTYK